MRRLLIPAIICLLLLVSTFARADQQLKDLDKWMTYYYLNPEPDKIALALESISDKGYFENNNAQAPLSGFFSEIFMAHPEKINDWVKPYIGIPKRHILYSALWTSGSPQSRAALEQMAEAASPEEAKMIRSLLATPPPTIESMSVNSPAAVDYLWGRFMASGSATPINRIIDQMKRANSEKISDDRLIGEAARWSISANARQHKRVLEIVILQSNTADPQTKQLLNEILAGINAENTKNAH